jgi:hypothetical protein
MAINKQRAYFSKFPLTQYKGKSAIDILKRVGVSTSVKNYLSAFYTHTMQRDETVDELAFNYYEDVNYDWLVYLANDIIDPHYDTSLTSLDFQNYIIKKYGTVRNAVRKIIHYRNNYHSDDTVLSASGYDALSPIFSLGKNEDPDSVGNPKKYWAPLISPVGIMGYQRAKENILYNTNKIMSFGFSSTMASSFKLGDIVERDEYNLGEIVFANTSVCNVKNVLGDFTSETNYIITNDAGVSATVNAASVATDRQVIPATEVVYQKAVSYYEYETELNDKKKEIFLVDKLNSKSLSSKLTESMR